MTNLSKKRDICGMLFRVVFLWICLLISFFSHAQADSVVYSIDTPLNDGIYLSYADFRRNHVIPKELIQSKLNPDQLDFIGKVMEQEQLNYSVNGTRESVSCKSVWGYVQNGTFYVNFNSKFYRIPVFGSISYLVAMVEVKTAGFYDPRFGGYTGAMTTTETREFLMNFYDGNLVELKMDQAEQLLSRDKALYQEYSQLSGRKQKEQLYRFIRRYNENNPIYFLK